jgi:hypothetical protein
LFSDLGTERGRAAMEQDPDLDFLWTSCTAGQADLRELIRLSAKTIKESEELLRRIDEQLARAPLKP